MPHDLGAGPKRSQRKATSNDFIQSADIGRDAIVFLCTTIGQPKPRDDFIKNQQDAISVAKRAQALKEPGGRGNYVQTKNIAIKLQD